MWLLAPSDAVAVRGRAGNMAALVGRLRRLSPVQLPAVLDVAERMDAAVLRGDVEGRDRARRERGISG